MKYDDGLININNSDNICIKRNKHFFPHVTHTLRLISTTILAVQHTLCRFFRAFSSVVRQMKAQKLENMKFFFFTVLDTWGFILHIIIRFYSRVFHSYKILFIARKHEFQIAHIPIWTSVSDVIMKFCASVRVTYPPSRPVPHHGEGV